MSDYDEVIKLYGTEGFEELLKEVEDSNPRFNDLPLETKKFAIGLIMTGKVLGKVPGLNLGYYTRRIPTIEEFLTAEYIGDTSQVLFGKWKDDLIKVFSPDSTILQWSLTGAIGTGKSTVGLIAQLYNLYRILSLRRPQLSMGSDPSKPMTLQLFTVTKEKAQATLMDRVKLLLKQNRYCTQVQHENQFGLYFGDPLVEQFTPWVDRGEEIIFPHSIKIVAGSQDRHALGEDVFGGLLDEAEYRLGAQGRIDKAFSLFDNIFERIRSRFLGVPYVLMTLISSISHEKGVMSTKIGQMRGDPTCRVSQYAIWETKFPEALKEDGHIWVVRGTQRHPSRVLDPEECLLADKGKFDIPPGCEVFKVPKRYQKDFELRTESSLMNLAGKASMGQEIPFDDLTRVEDKSLCPVLHLQAPLTLPGRPATKPIREQLPKNLFIATPNGLRFRRYPGAARYGGWDGAAVSTAGFAVVHKELNQTGRVMYVADLLLKITSVNRVNLEAVKEFIIDLRDVYGLSFHTFTADQYQSEQLLQKLTSIGFAQNVKLLSVVKTRNPYDTLSTVVAQDCLKTGQLRDLWQELEGVYFEKDKVMRQYNTSDNNTSHGDLADALCQAVYNAVQNPFDIPTNMYIESEEHKKALSKTWVGDFKQIYGEHDGRNDSRVSLIH